MAVGLGNSPLKTVALFTPVCPCLFACLGHAGQQQARAKYGGGDIGGTSRAGIFDNATEIDTTSYCGADGTNLV